MLRKQIKPVINPRTFKRIKEEAIQTLSESEYIPGSGCFPVEQVQPKKKQTTKN